MQLKRNWTQRYHWYPKPLAIRQQKTRLVHKHQPGNPRQRCYPCQGGQQWPPLFVFAAPCRGGRPCPPDLRPILFFLFWRKKRTAAASEETRCIPFPAKAENFISAPFLFLSESRPLRWVAFRLILERKRTSKNGSAPVSPNCDPAQRSQFGKEEGASGYGAFAASAEAECSWLLLTPRRTLS